MPRSSDAPSLFDLPLVQRSPPAPEPEPEHQPIQDELAFEIAPEQATGQPAGERLGPHPARFGDHLRAAVADLLLLVAAGLVALLGCELLGVRASAEVLPGLVLFLFACSFLLTIVPLAFWGRTLGMSWAGVEARTPEGLLPSFGQVLRRWLAGLLTLTLAGLPLLVALSGRSVADRLSGTLTRRRG
ncbi:MAG TPA: RDD family protein [Thermoanaerobaculia bacterium]|nr:RDD family protein [Thermoanaerobaculia bacterium]